MSLFVVAGLILFFCRRSVTQGILVRLLNMVCTEDVFVCFQAHAPLISSNADAMLAYTVLKFE